jgi:uncharacterized membrane protein (DUF106 family)
MDASSLPDWVQIVVMLSIAISAAVIGVFKYLKTETKSDLPDSSLISASLIDSKLLKELIESIREFQEEQSRDLKKSHRLSQDLREATNELNETMIVQTDATINLVKFINRENSRNRAADSMIQATGEK